MRTITLAHKIIVGVSFLILTGTGDAATLENCIDWSLTRNPTIRQISLEHSLDRPGKRVAVGQFLPSVSVGLSISQSRFYNPTFINPDGSVSTYPKEETDYRTFIDSLGYLRVDTSSIRQVIVPVPEGTRRASTSYIRLDETIFDGGRNYYNYKNALIAPDARQARLKDAGRLVRNGVTQAYAVAVSADRQFTLAGRMVAQRRLLLELANARLAAGSVTRRDVLQAEVDLGRAISDSLQTVLAIRRACENLNLVIGLPLDTSFVIEAIAVSNLPEFSLSELEQIALANRHDAVALNLSLLQGENEIKAQKGAYLPRVSAGLSHDRSERSGTSESFTLNPRNRNTTIDMTLSWLIFDRFTRELTLEQARVDHSKLEIERNNLLIEIRRQVRAALEALQSAFLQVQVAADNAQLAEQTLEFEQERYRLGSATLIELNAAQLSYYQAQTEQISLESQYLAAYGDLEAAIGKPLTEK